MHDNDGFGLDDAMLLGTGYALLRHGQDAQTNRLVRAIESLDDRLDSASDWLDDPPAEVDPDPINALDYTLEELPEEWVDYIGQPHLKAEIEIAVQSALARGVTLGHVLLESGFPGVGKTTMARLIAKMLNVPIIEVTPPFTAGALTKAAMSLPDGGVLFIDEIHKMTDGVGGRGAEILLKLLEDGVIYDKDGSVHVCHDICVIGATTEADKLPAPVIDRFELQPYFQPYSVPELAQITVKFVWKYFSETLVSNESVVAIAQACQGTPRIAGRMVKRCRDLSIHLKRQAEPEELLAFVEVEPDGMTRKHIAYITALRQFFPREAKDGGVEYIIGEAAIAQRLRETKVGIGRIEDFLIGRGLVDRTPRGRRLTDLGVIRAERFITEGKGFTHAA